MTASATSDRTFRDVAGFRLGAIPLIMAIGLFYLLATLPELFDALAETGAGYPVARQVTDFLLGTANSMSQAVEDLGSNDVDRLLVQGVLVGIPLLWVAALVRAARVENPRPLVATVAASVLGVLVFPVITWICGITVLSLRFAGFIASKISDFIAWLAPVFAVAIMIVLGLGALYLVYQLIVYLHKNRLWAAAAVVVLVGSALAGVISLGLLDDAFAWIGAVFRALAGWIATYLGPVVGVVVKVIVVVMLGLLVLGAVIGVLGQVGSTLYLPFVSVFRAGREQGRCINLAAGKGLFFSMLLCAGVTNSTFGDWLSGTWISTPVVGHIPVPIGMYEFLLPDVAGRIVGPAFIGYSPTAGAALFLVIIMLGILGMLFRQSPDWDTSRGSELARPVMIGVGMAVAMAIPLFLLALLARDE